MKALYTVNVRVLTDSNFLNGQVILRCAGLSREDAQALLERPEFTLYAAGKLQAENIAADLADVGYEATVTSPVK